MLTGPAYHTHARDMARSENLGVPESVLATFANLDDYDQYVEAVNGDLEQARARLERNLTYQSTPIRPPRSTPIRPSRDPERPLQATNRDSQFNMQEEVLPRGRRPLNLEEDLPPQAQSYWESGTYLRLPDPDGTRPPVFDVPPVINGRPVYDSRAEPPAQYTGTRPRDGCQQNAGNHPRPHPSNNPPRQDYNSQFARHAHANQSRQTNLPDQSRQANLPDHSRHAGFF